MHPTRYVPIAAFALAAAACSDGGGPIDPTGPYQFSATGTVHVPGGAVPAGLVASISGAGGNTSAPVGSDGRFTIQAQVEGDSVDILIDVPAGGQRTLLPALLRVAGRPGGQAHRIVLVPAEWTVQGGTYAGTRVNVSVAAAFRPPCAIAGDTNCDGFYPIDWVHGVKLWQPSMYPIRLTFDRANSHQPISASDSIALWNIVGTMNADAGMQLFRPAQATGLQFDPDGRPLDTLVAIRVDTTIAGFAAWTSWWWSPANDVIAGLVRPRSVSHMRNAGLMTHELLHTQGFKHSCSWSSVMGGYGCASAQRLTAIDVAHIQVAQAVHALQRSTGAGHGLTAALKGERAVLLGLSPLPTGAARRLAVPPGLIQGDSVSHGDHAH